MSPIKKPAASSQDYGRRPEMKGGKDAPGYKGWLHGGGASGTYRELIGRGAESSVLQRAVEVWRKHSEFKKPYLSDEFPEMEHYYSKPVNFPGSEYSPYEDAGAPSRCWDVCKKNHSGMYFDDDCFLLIWLHPLLTLVNEEALVDNDYAISMEFYRYGTLNGFGSSYNIYKSVESVDAETNIVWKVAQALFEACPGVDEVHAKSCRRTYNIADTCSDCPALIPIEWDYDTSVEIIAQDDSDTIVITGGLEPFAWEVSGIGFTVDEASTTIRTNTLNASAGANGTATITVTDSCGEATTGYVRCTNGEWLLLPEYTQGPVGAGNPDVGCFGLDIILNQNNDMACSAAPFVVNFGRNYVGIKGQYAIEEEMALSFTSAEECVDVYLSEIWPNYSCLGNIGEFGIFGNVFQDDYVGVRCNQAECTTFFVGAREDLNCCSTGGGAFFYAVSVAFRYFYVWGDV